MVYGVKTAFVKFSRIPSVALRWLDSGVALPSRSSCGEESLKGRWTPVDIDTTFGESANNSDVLESPF